MCCSGGGGGNIPSPDEVGRAQARYNRIDQYTPWGSVVYSGPDRNVATVNMSPEAQGLQESLMGLRQGALNQLMSRFGASPMPWGDDGAGGGPGGGGGGRYGGPGSGGYTPYEWPTTDEDGNPVDGDGLPIKGGGPALRDGTGAPPDPRLRDISGVGGEGGGAFTYGNIEPRYDLGLEGLGSIEDAAGRQESALFDRMMGLLNPGFEDEQSRLDEQLANRGMPVGSEETEILQRRLATSRGEREQAAALDAIIRSNAEARADRAQTVGERAQQFGQDAAMRNMLFGEDTTQYNQLAGILGLSPVQGPSGGIGGFFGPGSVDMLGAYGLQEQARQSNAGFGQDLLGGLFGLGGQLGGAALSNPTLFSDVSLKTDITPIDEDQILAAVEDIEVPAWRYIDDPTGEVHVGPMAGEFNDAFGFTTKMGELDAISTVNIVGVLMASVKALKKRVDELEGKV